MTNEGFHLVENFNHDNLYFSSVLTGRDDSHSMSTFSVTVNTYERGGLFLLSPVVLLSCYNNVTVFSAASLQGAFSFVYFCFVRTKYIIS